MNKFRIRCLIVLSYVILTVITATPAAAEFYVVYGSAGNSVVVDSRPRDASVMFEGPFTSHAEAEFVLKGVPALPVPPLASAVPPLPSPPR
ncbi:MAG: hypothetical protein RDU20_23290 [Desulfomonilaceae bacterium]|nr:hypothetical protein [Desulfomonilaceae bacterium]